MVGKKILGSLLCIALWTSIACENEETYLPYISEIDGSAHVMNFTDLPSDKTGLQYGNVHFYLHTRQNIDKAEELFVPKNDELINSTYFNGSNDVRVITHGWLSHTKTDWVQNIKKQFLNVADLNVILVDWNDLAKNPAYPWSALCTRYVGRKLAKLLDSLSRTYGVQRSSIHLIGHSLGAHVMGYAGMFYKEQVYRITGLDPARPLFELPEMENDFRLDETDADFVDIIHTTAKLGYRRSKGDADFYPNNGKSPQPGCESDQQPEVCSHSRAYGYFHESLFGEQDFLAYPCKDWSTFERKECLENETLMGDPALNTRYGDYYLRTRNSTPYAIGRETA